MSAPVPVAVASDPTRSRGRLHPEPESPVRTAFQRDRDRILHCGAFRRLQYKTQVFVFHEGDYYRTRLTHSLEVAQIARSIARALGVNEDLAEAVALAHDLGHTPFGHAGEDALDTAMATHGGFDHNVQTLRILTELERRYAEFDGLNLSWETLEGVVKHNGPVTGPLTPTGSGPPSPPVLAYDRKQALDLDRFPGLEAQVAALSDDIAYCNHDIDDGLRAGLFAESDLDDVPLVGPLLAHVRATYPGIDRTRLIHETIRRMIDTMVRDVVVETRRRLAEDRICTAEALRASRRPAAAFSTGMAADIATLKAFLFARMYRHYRVNRMTTKARRIVGELFDIFSAEPNTLPEEWEALTEAPSMPKTCRVVADYIAGMTDRFALDEHRRLYDRYSRT